MAKHFESKILAALASLGTKIEEHSRRLEKIEELLEKQSELSVEIGALRADSAAVEKRLCAVEKHVETLRVSTWRIWTFIAVAGGTGAAGAGVVEILKAIF